LIFFLAVAFCEADTRGNLIIPQNPVFAYNFTELIHQKLSRRNP